MVEIIQGRIAGDDPATFVGRGTSSYNTTGRFEMRVGSLLVPRVDKYNRALQCAGWSETS